MRTISPKTLGFDVYTLDLQRCSLLRGSNQVQLRPKSFDLLRYLVEHAGRLVSKEELIQAIWPDVFVTEDSVVQCIGDIRAALRDDAHRIIKTVPRRGYVFAAELSDMEPGKKPPAISSRSQETTFCRTEDGVNLAVACVGQGLPVVYIPTWATHLEYDWQSPIRGPLMPFARRPLPPHSLRRPRVRPFRPGRWRDFLCNVRTRLGDGGRCLAFAPLHPFGRIAGSRNSRRSRCSLARTRFEDDPSRRVCARS